MRRWLDKIVGGSAASTASPEPAQVPGDALRHGLASHQAGDLDVAENFYREHLASNANDAQALHLLGVLLAQRGEPVEALDLIERAVALNRNTAAMRIDLGNVRMLLGQSAEAVDAYRAATDLEPTNTAAWGNLGSALLAQGDVAGARDACLRGFARKPADAETLVSLAGTMRACGAREEAERACRDALSVAPGHLGALQVLGHLLLDRGEFAKALECFRMFVEAQPDNPFGYTWLGVALDRNGDDEAAIDACSKAVEMAPDEPEVHAGLAGVLWRARRLDDAVREFRQAVALDPTRLEPRANLAALLESMSRLREAASEADAGLAQHPNDAYLNLIAARCVRRAGDREQALRQLEAVDATSAPLDLRAQILYERGQLHDALGDSARAFDAFSEANAVAATSPQALVVSKARYLAEIAAAGVVVPRLPGIADSDSAPVAAESPAFVVGFPRSGTTLSDQILDSHPGACTLSEKPVVDRIVQRFADIAGGYPAALENVSPRQLATLRAEYHDLAATFVQAAPGELLVDRYPLNLVRLPAIWRLFPHARVVLALRHPCDVVLSCYMQHFSLNDAMVSFLDLEDAARLYDAVMGLWKICLEHLELDVHLLRYEALVGDFEGEVRALLAFLGLPWDDAVMDFDGHARRRGDINTPSYHQVTRRIYTEARERWRRYAEPLAPVLPLLAPWVEYFGYSLDLED